MIRLYKFLSIRHMLDRFANQNIMFIGIGFVELVSKLIVIKDKLLWQLPYW